MTSPLDDLPDFSLISESVQFEPTYYPERVNPKRERNIEREDSLCDGQDIIDNGAKNADLHVRGFLLESEKGKFWDVLDNGEEYELVAMPWSGFVKVKSGNLEGPLGVDDHEREFVYEYKLKFVSTGDRTEDQFGIVSEADSVADPAKNITFQDIYDEAGFTPDSESQELIESNAHYPFYIGNRNYVEWSRTVEIDETNNARSLVQAAESLTESRRSEIPDNKGIKGVRDAEEVIQ